MELNITQRTVLSLLGAHLFGRKADIDLSVDWDLVFEESADHSVLPLVYKTASSSVDISFDPKWNRKHYKIVSNNILNQKAHAELKEDLFGDRVCYVILKGVASALYYPDITLRTMGDVDFIVPQNQLDLAGKLLEEHGIVRTDKGEHYFHRNYFGNNLSWEPHWGFPGVPNSGKAREKAEYYLGTILDDRILIGDYYVPSEFHHGLIMLLHTAEHLTATGIGLRHLCDWAVYVDKIDSKAFVDMFEQALNEIGLWHLAKALTAVSHRYLGSSRKAWADDVDDEIVDQLMIDILDSGNFGRKDSQRMNQYKFFFNADDATINEGSKLKMMLIFLSSKAGLAMPIVNKVKILMPIGWIYVGVRHLFRIGRGKRTKINIKETISGAEKRGKLYQKLRLFEVE